MTAVVIACIAAGLVAAQFAYEPMLRSLTRGQQLVVSDLDEPFLHAAAFFALLGCAGAVVASCTIVTHQWLPRRALGAYLVLYAIAFIAATSVALVVMRFVWHPPALPPELAGILPAPVSAPLATLDSVPLFRIPLLGCGAVVILAIILIGIRVCDRWTKRPLSAC